MEANLTGNGMTMDSIMMVATITASVVNMIGSILEE
jgi:hypothetical protein